jgi:hypothetical protein
LPSSPSALQFSNGPTAIGSPVPAGAPESGGYVIESAGSPGTGIGSQPDNDTPSHTTAGFGAGSFGSLGLGLGHSGGGFGGGAPGGFGGGGGVGAPGAAPEHGLTLDPLNDLTPLLTAANDSSDPDEWLSPPSDGDGGNADDDTGSPPQGPPHDPPAFGGGDDPSSGSAGPNSPELIAFDEDLPSVTSDVPETESVTQSETDAAALPEPSSLALVALGLYSCAARRRKRAERKT